MIIVYKTSGGSEEGCMLASNAIIKSLDLIPASQRKYLGSQLTAGGCVTSISSHRWDPSLLSTPVRKVLLIGFESSPFWKLGAMAGSF